MFKSMHLPSTGPGPSRCSQCLGHLWYVQRYVLPHCVCHHCHMKEGKIEGWMVEGRGALSH